MFIACQSFLRKFYKKRIQSSLTLYFILSNFIKKINPIFLEFPQNYPHKTNLLRLLSTTFKKCPKYKESCSFLM